MVLFPRKGDGIRAHSVFFQAGQVRDKGIGVVTGMGVTRASSSSVTIASGTYKYNNALASYTGGSITGIPVASSGKHRYDIIVFDCPTASVKRIPGLEDSPTPYGSGFLDNKYPAPPELESETQILLAVVKVTLLGVPNETYGKYATGGVASIPLGLDENLNVAGGNAHDHNGAGTPKVAYSNISGVPSTFAPAAHASSHKSAGGDKIKLDELAAPSDSTALDVSTSLHGLFPKLPGTKYRFLGDGSWAQPLYNIGFTFGDGSTVLTDQMVSVVTEVGSIIKSLEIMSRDASGNLRNGSVTAGIYIHDRNTSIGSAFSSISLNGESEKFSDISDIWVSPGRYITCRIGGISSCTQVTVVVHMEAV